MSNSLDEILCPLGEGYHWYKAFVELKPVPGMTSWLFDIEETQDGPAVGGGFIHLVLAGISIRQIVDRIENVAAEENVELADIVSVIRVDDVSDLPMLEETDALDPAISDCIDAGVSPDTVAFGVIYLHSEDEDQN